MATRRHALAAIGGALVTGFGGCSSVLGPETTMDLEAVNYRDTALEVRIDVFRADADARDDPRLYGNEVELPVMSGENDIWRDAGIAPAQPCRIELHVRDTDQSYHTHYVPDTGRDDADTGVRVNFNTESGVGFHKY